jgi:lysophospholipid acyltransferase (LPLAT)-like uncharacterized protein
MKLESPLLMKIGGLAGVAFLRWWTSTLDAQIAFYDPAVDPGSPLCRRQQIYIFWHEYILLPLAVRGHCNLAMLLSQHRDAEILSRMAYHLGFEFIRGSSRRGGVAAIRQLLRKGRRLHLAITPDGPRGPRRRLAPGAIYLASRLGLPLILMGFGYDRPWRTASWDRFALPRPYSRVRAVISPQVYVPCDLDREGVEQFREKTERLLNRLTLEAESWAASGRHLLGQKPLLPAVIPNGKRNQVHPTQECANVHRRIIKA